MPAPAIFSYCHFTTATETSVLLRFGHAENRGPFCAASLWRRQDPLRQVYDYMVTRVYHYHRPEDVGVIKYPSKRTLTTTTARTGPASPKTPSTTTSMTTQTAKTDYEDSPSTFGCAKFDYMDRQVPLRTCTTTPRPVRQVPRERLYLYHARGNDSTTTSYERPENVYFPYIASNLIRSEKACFEATPASSSSSAMFRCRWLTSSSIYPTAAFEHHRCIYVWNLPSPAQTWILQVRLPMTASGFVKYTVGK
ncbi:hypothetical protein TRIUR3_30022 [Triticum urartu]|uniref:Uncharacterized protein n=1 Tax=Triticum urartu TaxID=4572 RepID=M8A1G1_TRIUA|nr:hypothetical protein TRIUR3_30022 [Triticum urartu]